jgi:hypothetical protein
LSKPHKGIVSGEGRSREYRFEGFGQSFLFRKGLSILDPYIISQLKLMNAVYVFGFDKRGNMQLQHDALFLSDSHKGVEFFGSCLKNVNDASVGFHKTETLGVRAIIRKSLAKEIVNFKEKKRKPEPWSIQRDIYNALLALNRASLHIEKLDADWMLAETPQCPPSKGSFVHFQHEPKRVPQHRDKCEVAFVEVFFKKTPSPNRGPRS